MTLELGGKSANVVFADADLEAAAAAAPMAVFGNAGQDCCARSRILVERARARRLHGGARGRGRGDAGRRPARRGDPDGPADLGRPARDGRLLRPRRRAGRDPRLGARRARATGSRRPCSRPVANDDRAAARGDLRPGRLRDPVRRRGGGGARSPTTRSTASRARSGPATARGRCGWRGRSRPACSRSTRTPRCGSRRPFGGFKQSGVGRELGPDALDHYTEVKNVYYATEESWLMAGRLEGKVCVITGAASGIGAEIGAAVRRRGRDGRRRRPRAEGSRGRPGDRGRRRRRGRRCERDVRRHARGSSAASTCCSTTPASTRPTTPRCSTPRSRPGSGSRTSTCAASSSAASTGSRTCSRPAAAR